MAIYKPILIKIIKYSINNLDKNWMEKQIPYKLDYNNYNNLNNSNNNRKKEFWIRGWWGVRLLILKGSISIGDLSRIYLMKVILVKIYRSRKKCLNFRKMRL